MLLIVFLILSLGLAATTKDSAKEAVSPVYPALLTVSQRTNGPIGIEALPVLSFDQSYFTDPVRYYPGELTGFGTPLIEVGPDPPPKDTLVNLITTEPRLAPIGVTVENTAEISGTLVDTHREVSSCMNVLMADSSQMAVSDRGSCRLFRELPLAADLNDALLDMQATYYHPRIRAEQSVSISFGGLLGAPANSASMRFDSPASAMSDHKLRGLLCHFDRRSADAFGMKREIENFPAQVENYVMAGYQYLWLFQGAAGRDYLSGRSASQASTALVMTFFNPNSRDDVTATVLTGQVAEPGGPLPDLMLFASMKDCEDTSIRLGNGNPLSPRANLSAFEVSLERGRITDVRGLEIEHEE